MHAWTGGKAMHQPECDQVTPSWQVHHGRVMWVWQPCWCDRHFPPPSISGSLTKHTMAPMLRQP